MPEIKPEKLAHSSNYREKSDWFKVPNKSVKSGRNMNEVSFKMFQAFLRHI